MNATDQTLIRYALLFVRQHLERPLTLARDDELLVEAAQEVRPDLAHTEEPLGEVLRREVDQLLAQLGR